MSAAYSRFARAARLEAFRARVLPRTTPRPAAALEEVFRMASPAYGWRTPDGALADVYVWQRRMAVTRAWAAMRLARMTGWDTWRREAREALREARRLRHLGARS